MTRANPTPLFLLSFCLIAGPALVGQADAQGLIKPPSKQESSESAGTVRNGIRLDRPVGAPVPGPATPAGNVLTTLGIDDLLAIAKEAGLTEASAAMTDDKRPYIRGTFTDVSVEMVSYQCKEICENYDMFAYFGKQDAVDDAFMNAFNNNFVVKLTKIGGNLVLRSPIRLQGGVTREHVKWLTSVFLSSIRDALTFRPS